MRFLLFAVLAWLLTFSAAAQSIVRGKVLDGKDQSPLIGANAVLIHLPDSVRTGSAVGPDGSFEITGVAPGRYVFLASYVGYKDQRQPLTVPAGGEPISLGTVTLATGGIALKTVVVTGQAVQQTQRGDTTSINAKAFKVNVDATAGDLIGKMPGIAVDAQGKTQAQGEQVQQVLVDGKPFFGTDPDAVLKNLPAEAIDRVEIFDQQSEQSRFSGFNDGNTQKTLNIITKPQFHNGQFGRAVGGIGPDGNDRANGTSATKARYRASLNLNDFHGNRRTTVLAQSNNVNEQNFGTDDLLGVIGNSGGGGGGRGGRGGGGGGSGANPGDFLVNQSGGISTTNAAGLNYSNSWNRQHTQLNGSYFFNRSNNTLNSTTNRQFVNGTLYQETSQASSLNYNHRANFRFEQQLDTATSLLFRPRLSWQQNDANNTLLGITSNNGQPQSQLNTLYNSDNRGINPGGDLLLRRRLGQRAGRTISLNITGAYTNRQGTNYLNSTSVGGTSATLNQRSTLAQNSGNIGGNLAYTEPLGKQSQLQANYSLNYAPNNSDKRTFNFESGDYTRLDTALSNVFNNYYLTQGGGLSYRYNTRKIQFSAGVSAQVAQLRGDQTFPIAGPVDHTFWNILPQAMLMFRPDRQHNLRVFYRTSTNAPSINQLQAVVNNSNPLQLTIGNPDLKQEYAHNLVARYSGSNPEKKGNFFALLSGSFTQNPISNSTIVASRATVVQPEGTNLRVLLPVGGQLTQSTNLSNQYSLRTLGNYGSPLFGSKINVNASLGGSFSQNPGLVNGGLNYARTPAATLGLTLSSNISQNLDFTLSSNSTQSYVRNTLNTQLNTSYFNQLTRLRLSWIVGPGISFQTDVTHTLYRGLSSAYNQDYVLWNASLGKKLFPGQRGEIKLYAFDLLAQNRAIQRNVNVAYVEDVQTTVLQRYFMLMFTYNIRSANMTALPEGPGQGERRGRGGFDGPPGGGRPGGFPGGGGGGFGGPPGG
ncbi:outer membrane beta-barrel protein [Hymenobacter ginsengisoli]|uniref:Outer membrane beta-barrel protein n=1 Tax=Hymenobacter ginsengisoli TaxID=1051626 RepID=A0ABP8Q7G8_9BACT|nr:MULTISPECIES: TonB-dependent receptor [unclassified Hymenobacter]MBO2031000.1 TonB-dependent receptor [Hymenobacter sp. BT559]